MHTAPVEEVVAVLGAEGMLGVDREDKIRPTGEVEGAKISEAEVHGQTVMVDSTVTVTVAVALRANSPIARTAPEKCILAEVEGLKYYVQKVGLFLDEAGN